MNKGYIKRFDYEKLTSVDDIQKEIQKIFYHQLTLSHSSVNSKFSLQRTNGRPEDKECTSSPF